MHAAHDRPEFAPPPEPALLRAFALAVLAHVLLLFALMHGLRWQRETQDAAVEAELWSALPQQAAPKPEPRPEPRPEPPPVVAPPPPPPVVQAPPQPEPPVKSEADIALEREKQQRLEEEQRRLAELERQRAEKAKLEAQRKREEELARRKEEQQKKLAEAKRKEEEQQRKLAEAKRKEEERQARLAREAAAEEKKRQQIREDTMKRMQALAGTGAPGSTGTAARSAGPSGSWAGKVVARVRPNIAFADDVPGNPEAVVEVRLAPDGTIVSRKLKKSSGFKAYDEAVLRALDKTEVLPRDTDGTVPKGGDLVFRPKG